MVISDNNDNAHYNNHNNNNKQRHISRPGHAPGTSAAAPRGALSTAPPFVATRRPRWLARWPGWLAAWLPELKQFVVVVVVVVVAACLATICTWSITYHPFVDMLRLTTQVYLIYGSEGLAARVGGHRAEACRLGRVHADTTPGLLGGALNAPKFQCA